MRGLFGFKPIRTAIFAVSLLCAIFLLSPNQADAFSGGTNLPALNVSVSNTVSTTSAGTNVGFVVRAAGSSMSSGTMTVTIYCDTPAYFTIVGPGAPVFQYPGLPIDLRTGYKLKQTIAVTPSVTYSNTCTYTGKGVTYQPVIIVEHSGYAAWQSTTVTTIAPATPTPTAAPSVATGWKAMLNGSVANTAIAPFTDTLYSSVFVPDATQPGAFSLLRSAGPFNHYLYCNGSAGTSLTPAPNK